METIKLQSVMPDVFSLRDDIRSEIWQQEVTFQKGGHYLIEAASGTGKSSLCSFLFGYRDDYKGSVYFDQRDIRNFFGEDWNHLRRNSLSILFQDLRLFPELTAMENVLIKNNLTGFKTGQWITQAFERLGIGDKPDVPAGKLSFGQQQRTALIRALCQPMDFILLDEPVSHLDNASAQAATGLLLEEAGQQGTGILVTSIGKHPEISYSHTLLL